MEVLVEFNKLPPEIKGSWITLDSTFLFPVIEVVFIPLLFRLLITADLVFYLCLFLFRRWVSLRAPLADIRQLRSALIPDAIVSRYNVAVNTQKVFLS